MADNFNFGASIEEDPTPAALSYPLDAVSTEIIKKATKEFLPELNRVQSLTLKSGDVSFDVRASDRMKLEASAAVTIATITSGYNGQVLTLVFADGNVTITDNNTTAQNTINLAISFTSEANATLELVHDGNKWFELRRSTSTTDVQTFTASGTWTKPAGKFAFIQCWGGGGSGGSLAAGAGGGGGGSYSERLIALSSLGATETVTIGNGGTAVTNGAGNGGGNSTFGSLLTAYGGGGGGNVSNAGGGGGGGITSAGANVAASSTGGAGGAPIGGAAPGGTSNFGGGAGGSTGSTGGASVHGGGGGGGSNGGNGGASYYGGGGGGAGGTSTTGGISIQGGAGGTGGDTAGEATAGAVPSGGGGGMENTAVASGAGGDGKCVVTVF